MKQSELLNDGYKPNGLLQDNPLGCDDIYQDNIVRLLMIYLIENILDMPKNDKFPCCGFIKIFLFFIINLYILFSDDGIFNPSAI